MSGAQPTSDALALVPKVRARLESSVSGYVRVARFSARDRAAIAVLIEQGEAAIINSPIGRAYRLTRKKEVPGE